jgi:hypothetical protein
VVGFWPQGGPRGQRTTAAFEPLVAPAPARYRGAARELGGGSRASGLQLAAGAVERLMPKGPHPSHDSTHGKTGAWRGARSWVPQNPGRASAVTGAVEPRRWH